MASPPEPLEATEPPDEPAPEAHESAEDVAAETHEHEHQQETVDDPNAPAGSFREWRRGKRLPRDFALLFGLGMPTLVLAVEIWRSRPFTVDDAYISYRYARNLANGLGLVYNAGERIEGYTNFLWTLMLAVGIKLGVDPDAFAKVFGSLFAFGGLALTYAISGLLRPYKTAPCFATWLLATTVVYSGYAVFGLETGMFVFLLLAGTYLFLRETGDVMRGPKRRAAADEPTAFPYSGLVFAAAGLTRPEAPMYIGILMLALGRRWFFGRQNLIRGAIFAAPIAAHLLFRHSYYGAWFPNTLTAKTANVDTAGARVIAAQGKLWDAFWRYLGPYQGQVRAGWAYVGSYVAHAGPVLWLGFGGLGIGLAQRRRDILALAATVAAVIVYVSFVGGDWMPFFRFMAPFEPFCFLLIDLAIRALLDRRERAATWAVALFALVVGWHRDGAIKEAQETFLNKEKHFWDKASGGTARWLLQHNVPGEIAIGDIGYVGYATNYPVLDLLGLVDPTIAKLPGAYTQKLGPGFADHFFARDPKYTLIISSTQDCTHPSVPGSQVLYHDRRFSQRYHVEGKVLLDGGFAWCIFSRPDGPAASPPQ